jgi:hypothetical protein
VCRVGYYSSHEVLQGTDFVDSLILFLRLCHYAMDNPFVFRFFFGERFLMVEGNECFHVLLHVWLLKDSIKVSAFILNGFDEF